MPQLHAFKYHFSALPCYSLPEIFFWFDKEIWKGNDSDPVPNAGWQTAAEGSKFRETWSFSVV